MLLYVDNACRLFLSTPFEGHLPLLLLPPRLLESSKDHLYGLTEKTCLLPPKHCPPFYTFLAFTFFLKGLFIFILCAWVFFLHVCLHTMYMPGTYGGHKKVSDLLELELQMTEPPCRCWESNPGPLGKFLPFALTLEGAQNMPLKTVPF